MNPVPFVLAVVAALLGAVAIGGALATGMSWAEAVDTYLLTNTAIGLAFPACGVILAAARPRNPVGWLFILGGLAHLVTAALTPLPPSTLMEAAWPWSIGVFLPVALQLFPTGRPVGPRWRWVVAGSVIAGAAFALTFGLLPEKNFTLVNLGVSATYAATVASLVVRYRRGDEVLRRQLLWLVLALIGMLVVNAQRWAVGNGPVLTLLALPLIPLAVTVAILRYGLLDIRLVVSRALAYGLLTALVIGGYVGLVALLGRLGVPLLAVLAVAIAFNPARVALQRAVDRAVYGSRGDPVRAVAQVGERLQVAEGGLADVVRDALRLPYVAVPGSESGVEPARTHTVPLRYGGEDVGALVVGLRAGERVLSAADTAVLGLLAAPVAAAVHATALSAEVQASRQRIVAAREEERRRLHRDLHDGLGPTLTGAGFKADAALNLLGGGPPDPPGGATAERPGGATLRAAELLAELRADIGTAIGDVRRAVYGLRPPLLDEVGLVSALHRQAESLPLPVVVDAPDDLPALPAAVEVAAYRIAVEAMTNVARHAAGGRATVALTATDSLVITVTDDGAGQGGWVPGVGLRSIQERAAELGGTCAAGPTGRGGRVVAVLPLPAAVGVAP